jgi:NADPH:quinone reductase-like Zn-dependent oxidoreductase
VVKTGQGVSGWQVGDQVCALMIGDGYSTPSGLPIMTRLFASR